MERPIHARPEFPLRSQPELLSRSCTECRRRKQKCKPSLIPDGPCANCAKRYPPVVCVKSQLDGRLKSNRRPYKDVQYQVQVVINNEQPLESPRTFFGLIAGINTAGISPIDSNAQNAQLLYYYVQRVIPLIASLDGKDPPPELNNSLLPCVINSPLLPKIAILEAAIVRELFQPCDLAANRILILLKGEIIARINEFITKDFNKTYREAIQSVLHIALLEYYWGERASVVAHMNGLKSMIKLRGGIESLESELFTKLITLLDLQIACGYEKVPSILTFDLPVKAASQCPQTFENPFHESATPFSTVLEQFYVLYELATILDDVRSLTSSITSIGSIKCDLDDPLSQQQNAITITDHAFRILHATRCLPSTPLTPSSPPADLIHEILRTTIIIYTTAISSRLPLSIVYTPALRRQVYHSAMGFQLSNWKHIPGLQLWVLLLACPGSGKDPLGRLLRSHKSLATIYTGLKDFEFTVSCLRSFLGVQRWITGGILNEGSVENLCSDIIDDH